MNTYNIIITAILITVIGLSIFIGIKRGLWRTLISLACNIIAALAAFGIARLMAPGIGRSITAKVSGLISSLVPSDTTGLLDLPEISVWTLTASRVIVSIAAFSAVYIILFLLLKIPANIIYKKFFEEKEIPQAGKAVSPVLRVLSGIIMFILLLSPICALSRELDNDSIDSYQYASITPVSQIQTFAHYPVVKAASAAGGHAFFDALTSFKNDGAKITPSSEVGYVAKFAFNSYDIFSFEKKDTDETKSSLANIDSALEDSSLLAPSIGSAVPYIAKQWLDGKSCMGISIDIPDGRFGSVIRKMLNGISKWTADDVRRDFGILIDLMDLINNKNFGPDATPKDMLDTFSDKDYTTELFTKLNSSEELREALPDLIYSSVGTVLDEIGVDMPGDYDIEAALASFTDEHAADEAAIFSNIASTISDIYDENNSMSLSDMNDEQQQQLKDAVEELKKSHILDGDATDTVISALDKALADLKN